MRELLSSAKALRRWALASLIVNVGLVASGGAVRLTGSGLGCPTWPRCTDSSYVTTPAMGIEGLIEFGNRMVIIGMEAVVTLTLISALMQRPRRRRITTWAAVGFAFIPAQAVVGGIVVLSKLNPWVVAVHLLLSPAAIAASYILWRASGPESAAAAPPGPAAVRRLAELVTAVAALTLAAGTVVTGSGPHAGNAEARRTGFNPETVAGLHADIVWVLISLSVGLWLTTKALGAASRLAAVLVAVELGQGAIGYIQYYTHLPALVVELHMVGACAVWVAALSALAATRGRPAVAASAVQPVPAEDGTVHQPAAIRARSGPMMR